MSEFPANSRGSPAGRDCQPRNERKKGKLRECSGCSKVVVEVVYNYSLLLRLGFLELLRLVILLRL